jgi:hypothetical protein
MSQFADLTGHFFCGMFDQDLLARQSESRHSIAPILAVLAVPGVFMSMYQWPKYVRLAFEPPVYREAAAAIDRLMFVFLSMVAIGFVTVVQWDALFPDHRDYRILGPLPLSFRDIFASKMAALAAFFGLFAVDLNIASTLLFPGALVTPHDTLGYLIRLTWSHAVAVLAAAAFVVVALVTLQGVLMNLLPARIFRRVSLYVQFAVMFGLLSALFLWPKVSSLYLPLREKAGPELFYCPVFWFAGLYQQLAGAGSAVDERLADMAVVALAAAALAAILVYTLSYRRHVRRSLETLEGEPGGESALGSLFERLANRLVVRTPVERATFHFIARTMLRSKHHRLMLAAYVGVGLALIVQEALTASDTLKFFQYRPDSALATLPLILSFFLLSGMRAIFAMPAELRANWAFRLTEMDSQRECLSGVRKAMWVFGVAPLLAWLWPIYHALWGWRSAAHHLVFGLALSLILIEVLLLRFRKIPFTCSYLPGKNNPLFVLLIYWLGFATYAYTMSRFGYWVFQRPLRMVVTYAFIACALAALAVYRNRLLEEDSKLVFEEQYEPAVQRLQL